MIPTLCVVFQLWFCGRMRAQLPMTIPWSPTVNINFENGSSSPLSPGFSDFTYTSGFGFGDGYYTVVRSSEDAGHFYYGPFTWGSIEGNKMMVRYNSSFSSKTVFGDTVRGLCGSMPYLFWAEINSLNNCLDPSLTFSVETLTGSVIASFQTGNIGGTPDHYSWYYGYYDPIRTPKVPYYGGTFELPPGVKDIVVKIMTNPTSSSSMCSAIFQMDNILLMPIGPDVRIYSSKYPGGYIAASCFQGNVPLELRSRIDSGYRKFGTPDYILRSYSNPAFQWQESLDNGYTWMDIPGETSSSISHNFNNIDTFWMRMRVSEAVDITNPKCSNVSNVMQIQVDGFPKDFSLTTNSPVCTDGDLKLALSGGVTYNTFGPNGFFDDSPFPHIYHPPLADSGWYYSEIMSFGGCKGVDSEYVRIIGPNIKVGTGKAICYGDTVHLHASGGAKYSWTPSTGLNNAGIADPVATGSSTTQYEVKVTDNSGCSAYGEVVVTLRDSILIAKFTGPEITCPNDQIQFTDTSEGMILNWQWNFGNGNSSNLKNPLIQHYPVLNDVLLPVELSVTDTAGCTQTIKKFIRSVNNCYIAVPTAFTPNNDGLNDLLYPMNAYKATHLSFKVFNRWGNLVFATSNWTKGWDGKSAGQPLASGVYVWMLNYTDENQKPVFLKGTVTLIR